MRILLTWLSSELVSNRTFGVLGAFRVERTQLQSRKGFWRVLANEDATLSAPTELSQRLQGGRWSDRRSSCSAQGSLRRASYNDESIAATTSARTHIIDSSRGLALLRGNHDREVDMHISTGEEDADRRHEASLLCRERIWSQNDELRDDQMDNTQRARYEQRLADLRLQAEEQLRENALRYEEQVSLWRRESQLRNRKRQQEEEEVEAATDRVLTEARETELALSEQRETRAKALAKERAIGLEHEFQLGLEQARIRTLTRDNEVIDTWSAQRMAEIEAALHRKLESDENERRDLRRRMQHANSELRRLRQEHSHAQHALRENDRALARQQQHDRAEIARLERRVAEIEARLRRDQREKHEAEEKVRKATDENNEVKAALQEARNQKRERDRKRAEEEKRRREEEERRRQEEARRKQEEDERNRETQRTRHRSASPEWPSPPSPPSPPRARSPSPYDWGFHYNVGH
ncbi:unnamed protein product [Amoebophrya sp. A120]|nr:unnamed protein product [Amoebophrya sp. A120]|eukprot:GSA120T00025536001.1